MGIVLQMAGIFIVLPIILSFYYNELSATIALFLAAITFLVLGFFMNTLAEKVKLNYKQSCTLIVLVFILMSLIGAFPYIYVNISQGDIVQNITDSVFESASGYTTTGFSVIQNVTALPKSIVFYRALTQFIGGIGIVLVLLAFFYPDVELTEFARSMGFGKNHKIKRAFFLVLVIYLVYTLVMSILGIVFGYPDIIQLISFIFSALSTGGFTPINNITTVATNPPLNVILILSMILGAINFFVLAGLFKAKFKEFLKSETTVFLVMAAFSVTIVIVFFQLSFFDALFQIISTMSTAGFSYLSIADFTDGLKLFLIFLMFVGGASLSTAGGIKIYRFLLILKATKKAIIESITQKETKPLTLFGREYSNGDVNQAMIIVFLMIGIIFSSTFIVSYYGFQPINALFDCTSALATTGLSAGVVGPSLALELKWFFVFLMIIGRVEILAFFIVFSRVKEEAS